MIPQEKINQILEAAKQFMGEFIPGCSVSPKLPDVIGMVLYHLPSDSFGGGVIYQASDLTASVVEDMGFALKWAAHVITGEESENDNVYQTKDNELVVSLSFRNYITIPELEIAPSYKGLKMRLFAEILYKAQAISLEEYYTIKLGIDQ